MVFAFFTLVAGYFRISLSFLPFSTCLPLITGLGFPVAKDSEQSVKHFVIKTLNRLSSTVFMCV